MEPAFLIRPLAAPRPAPHPYKPDVNVNNRDVNMNVGPRYEAHKSLKRWKHPIWYEQSESAKGSKDEKIRSGGGPCSVLSFRPSILRQRTSASTRSWTTLCPAADAFFSSTACTSLIHSCFALQPMGLALSLAPSPKLETVLQLRLILDHCTLFRAGRTHVYSAYA